MVEIGHLHRKGVEHDEQFALGPGRGRRVVDVGDKEALDTFAQMVDDRPASRAASLALVDAVLNVFVDDLLIAFAKELCGHLLEPLGHLRGHVHGGHFRRHRGEVGQ